MYYVLQISTMAILTLAANTAFADFPRIASILARDGYLPRQLHNRGDRLVFSNGIVALRCRRSGCSWRSAASRPRSSRSTPSACSAGSRCRSPAWSSTTNASGARLASPGGQRRRRRRPPARPRRRRRVEVHHRRLGPGRVDPVHRSFSWRSSVTTTGPGAATRARVPAAAPRHTVVVLVGSVHRAALAALAYAKSLAPDRLFAFTVASDEEEAETVQQQWAEFGLDVPLRVLASPYRELSVR